jgi:hypothetical protein
MVTHPAGPFLGGAAAAVNQCRRRDKRPPVRQAVFPRAGSSRNCVLRLPSGESAANAFHVSTCGAAMETTAGIASGPAVRRSGRQGAGRVGPPMQVRMRPIFGSHFFPDVTAKLA